MDVRRVLVVGAGQMGAGIAQVVAASGREVLLYDAVAGATERAREAMRRSLAKLAERGGPEPEAVLQRVTTVTRIEAATDVDLMVEAVVEDLAVKQTVFRDADAALADGASLASATRRPERVVGMHFFNPVPLMRLVEVIRTPATSEETARAVVALARELGKEPVEVRDVAGFVANRILMPFINEAVRALEDGVAGAEGIDTVARLGFGHPMGPLALADLIGLDTCVAIMEVLRAELGDARFEPARLLREHVAAGRLGRKAGEGFYRY